MVMLLLVFPTTTSLVLYIFLFSCTKTKTTNNNQTTKEKLTTTNKETKSKIPFDQKVKSQQQPGYEQQMAKPGTVYYVLQPQQKMPITQQQQPQYVDPNLMYQQNGQQPLQYQPVPIQHQSQLQQFSQPQPQPFVTIPQSSNNDSIQKNTDNPAFARPREEFPMTPGMSQPVSPVPKDSPAEVQQFEEREDRDWVDWTAGTDDPTTIQEARAAERNNALKKQMPVGKTSQTEVDPQVVESVANSDAPNKIIETRAANNEYTASAQSEDAATRVKKSFTILNARAIQAKQKESSEKLDDKDKIEERNKKINKNDKKYKAAKSKSDRSQNKSSEKPDTDHILLGL